MIYQSIDGILRILWDFSCGETKLMPQLGWQNLHPKLLEKNPQMDGTFSGWNLWGRIRQIDPPFKNGACDKRLQRRYGLPPWFFPRFIIYVGVVEFLYVYPLCGQTHSDRMAPQKLRQRSGCQESSTPLDGIVANAISHFFGVGLRLADEKSWLFHFGFSPHTWWVTTCFAPASGWTIPAAPGVRPSHKFHQISQDLRRFFNKSSDKREKWDGKQANKCDFTVSPVKIGTLPTDQSVYLLDIFQNDKSGAVPLPDQFFWLPKENGWSKQPEHVTDFFQPFLLVTPPILVTWFI